MSIQRVLLHESIRVTKSSMNRCMIYTTTTREIQRRVSRVVNLYFFAITSSPITPFSSLNTKVPNFSLAQAKSTYTTKFSFQVIDYMHVGG